MNLSNESLTLDFLEWLHVPRPYDEVMDAWRTSCPRLSIWEDALDAGFVERHYEEDGSNNVQITEKGSRFLLRRRPA